PFCHQLASDLYQHIRNFFFFQEFSNDVYGIPFGNGAKVKIYFWPGFPDLLFIKKDLVKPNQWHKMAHVYTIGWMGLSRAKTPFIDQRSHRRVKSTFAD